MTDNFARLLALMGGNGGSGGTTDYEALTNKPSNIFCPSITYQIR